MAYLDTKHRPRAASMAAVVAVHGAVGAALILGLTISGTIPLETPPILTFDAPKDMPPPPKPPEAKPDETKAEVPRKDIVVPTPPIDFKLDSPKVDAVDTTRVLLPTIPTVGTGEGLDPILPTSKPTSSIAPTTAKPRNDPARWVSTEDYRGNWIRREWTGRAGFRLDIAADGRVARCTITSSSGHGELDEATCALVSKRARFQPARDGSGQAVAGSYSNVIDWRLPD